MTTELQPIPKIRRVYYDTYANLPVISVASEDLGYATDTGLLYRWSGAAWQPITQTVDFVLKTANETVNNSIVLQNDNELLFPMGANEIWEVTLFIIYNSSNAAGFAWAFTAPVACVFDGHKNGWAGINASHGSFDETVGSGETGWASDVLFSIHLIVRNGANAGNLQFQWAQMTAEVSNTIVRASSCIIANKLA